MNRQLKIGLVSLSVVSVLAPAIATPIIVQKNNSTIKSAKENSESIYFDSLEDFEKISNSFFDEKTNLDIENLVLKYESTGTRNRDNLRKESFDEELSDIISNNLFELDLDFKQKLIENEKLEEIESRVFDVIVENIEEESFDYSNARCGHWIRNWRHFWQASGWWYAIILLDVLAAINIIWNVASIALTFLVPLSGIKVVKGLIDASTLLSSINTIIQESKKLIKISGALNTYFATLGLSTDVGFMVSLQKVSNNPKEFAKQISCLIGKTIFGISTFLWMALEATANDLRAWKKILTVKQVLQFDENFIYKTY